jgi:hypothetical protein
MKVVLEKAANECANVLQPSTKPEFNLLHGTLKFNQNLHDVTDSFESGYIWSKKNEGIPEAIDRFGKYLGKEKRKRFFFEKKKQKTFIPWLLVSLNRH